MCTAGSCGRASIRSCGQCPQRQHRPWAQPRTALQPRLGPWGRWSLPSSTAPSSPPLARSPFSKVSGQKAAPRARQGPQKHSRFGTVKPRGSRSPLGERFTLSRPSGRGVGVREPAGLAAPARCRGYPSPPPAHKPLSWEGGVVSVAQAQRLPRPKAERMRRFVPGKSTWELWSVWPIANPCPSPEFSTPTPGATLPRLGPGDSLVRGILATPRNGI